MTPGARIAAAIGILDRVGAGEAAERALTNWARASRFAGAKDRAAVRDHVFDALRRRRSFAALGGSATGRGLMIGALRARGTDPAELFTGEGHAPAPLSGAEAAPPPAGLPANVALDCPDWLAPRLRAALGADFAPVMEILRHRAPVFLRVNTARLAREAAIAALAEEGIEARPGPLAAAALEVTEGARRIQSSRAWAGGLVELQDAASQAVVEALPVTPGMRALDYCAGGGGKAIAPAARGARVAAHDVSAARMRDIPVRAARAGVEITRIDAAGARAHRWDLVLVDAPCSGSGSWRRAPEGKWLLDEARLAGLLRLQAAVLDEAAALVAPEGTLAYATCSLLDEENRDQVAAFLTHRPDWRRVKEMRLTPRDGGDGFYLAVLTRG